MRYALLLLALNLALVLHELGHLAAALIMRVKVREVRLGLGPPLFTVRARGVRYSVGSLLIGAHVELEGENPFRARTSNGTSPQPRAPARPDDAPAGTAQTGEPIAAAPNTALAGEGREDPITAAPPPPARGPSTPVEPGPRRLTGRQRLLLALAGPVGSALAAIGLLALLHMNGTHVPVRLTVGKVLPGSPAALAGVQPGDRVTKFGELEPDSWSELLETAAERMGQSLPLVVLRGDREEQLQILLPDASRLTERELGVSQQYSYQQLPAFPALGAATVHARVLLGSVMDTALGLLSSPADEGLAPVMDVRQSAERASPGLDTLLRGAALWSLLLALLHLLPIPPLDGGGALLAAIGLWRKRPLSPAIELTIAALGLVLVLAVGMIWVRRRVPLQPPAPASTKTVVDAAPVASDAGASPAEAAAVEPAPAGEAAGIDLAPADGGRPTSAPPGAEAPRGVPGPPATTASPAAP